ncbi:MAG: universal stress protein [Bacteroidetes bacterium]|nr:universal stress protein [Bacteroidota bacterium]MBS1931838.1 universal stress protein [Bacteroidota bacterium]
MHRVIVAIDFSEISMNAARFAADSLAGQKETTIILYHNFQNSHDCNNCISYLESLKKEFLDKGVEAVEYENEMGGHLVDNLERLAHTRRATSVVMGIKGSHSVLKEAVMGNSTLEMVERSFCPVLIIPADAKFNGIKNVAFASEFIDVEMTTPAPFIKSVLDMFNPFLHIVNVNSKHYVALTEDFRKERAKMDEMFKDYKHEFYFIGMYNFYEAINNFIKDYKIDMLITIPRHHMTVMNTLKGTHTQKLAYHTTIPLLAVHQ